MTEGQIVIAKVWRSELKLFTVFFLACILSVVLSKHFPGSVVSGELITIGSYRVMMALPLFWLIPLLTLGMALFRIYDVKYVLDGTGIETRIGILSTFQRVTRVHYEDIRSAETEQSITERMMDIGDIFIGTSAQAGIEIAMEGVAHPAEILDMINRERDRRQKIMQRPNGSESEHGASV